jgi:hypothetical protein
MRGIRNALLEQVAGACHSGSTAATVTASVVVHVDAAAVFEPEGRTLRVVDADVGALLQVRVCGVQVSVPCAGGLGVQVGVRRHIAGSTATIAARVVGREVEVVGVASVGAPVETRDVPAAGVDVLAKLLAVAVRGAKVAVAGKGAAVGVNGAERTAGVRDDARIVPIVGTTVRGRQQEASSESRLQRKNNNRR